MRLPRDLSGDDLVGLLGRLGYEVKHQTGSHVRLARKGNGEHRITVPRHRQLRVGTLAGILKDVSEQLKVDREALVRRLLG